MDCRAIPIWPQYTSRCNEDECLKDGHTECACSSRNSIASTRRSSQFKLEDARCSCLQNEYKSLITKHSHRKSRGPSGNGVDPDWGEAMVTEATASTEAEAAPRLRTEDEINELAHTVAKSISDQLKALGAYKTVEIEVPEIAGIAPRELATHAYRFSDNIRRIRIPGITVRYMKLKVFTLEVGPDHLYTGKATGNLIDDTWSL